MDQLDDILQNTEHRALAIARLLRLIEMDSAIIERQQTAAETGSYLQQYVELREQNLAKLARLIEGNGPIQAQLRVNRQAA